MVITTNIINNSHLSVLRNANLINGVKKQKNTIVRKYHHGTCITYQADEIESPAAALIIMLITPFKR
jgi:hypothetical protein